MQFSESLTKTEENLRVLADSNIIIEYFFNRSGFVDESERLMEIVTTSKIQLFVTASCREKIRLFIDKPRNAEVISIFDQFFQSRILYPDEFTFEQSRESSVEDIEASFDVVLATQHKIDIIVTNNPNKYLGAELSALTVESLQQRLKLEGLFSPGITSSTRLETVNSNSRDSFNQCMKSIIQQDDCSSLNIWSFIRKTLHQFDLQGTYSESHILNVVYLRGIEAIQRGKIINSPFGWIRATAFSCIRELSRDQKKGTQLDQYCAQNSLLYSSQIDNYKNKDSCQGYKQPIYRHIWHNFRHDALRNGYDEPSSLVGFIGILLLLLLI